MKNPDAFRLDDPHIWWGDRVEVGCFRMMSDEVRAELNEWSAEKGNSGWDARHPCEAPHTLTGEKTRSFRVGGEARPKKEKRKPFTRRGGPRQRY